MNKHGYAEKSSISGDDVNPLRMMLGAVDGKKDIVKEIEVEVKDGRRGIEKAGESDVAVKQSVLDSGQVGHEGQVSDELGAGGVV